MWRPVSIFLTIILLLSSSLCAQNLLSGPESVAWDSLYNRYLVSNWQNGTIVSITPEGEQTPFTSGHGICMGNVIKGDILYSSCGTFVKGFDLATGDEVFSVHISGSNQLDGMTADTSGFLYVIDSRLGYVIKLNPADSSYSALVSAGIPNATQDAFFDAAHNRVLIAAWVANADINAVDPNSGIVTSLVTTPFGWIDGISMDEFGNTYVTSYQTGEIYRYDSTYTNPPQLISSGYDGPAGIDFNKQQHILAIPEVDGHRLTLLSDIGGVGIGEVHLYDDTYGNGNGVPEAGETIEVVCELTNSSYNTISDIELSITIDDQSLTISNNDISVGSAAFGITIDNDADRILFEIPSPYTPRLNKLTVTASGNSGDKTVTATFDIKVGMPDILLIDDDNGDDIEQYYLECFNDFRVPCSVWTAPPDAGGVDPDSSDLNKFDIVVWYTGDDRLPFESNDYDAIQGYLDGGGNLFLTGQGIAAITELINPTFLPNYLRCNRLSSGYIGMLNALAGGNISEEADTLILFGNGAANQTNPDHLEAANGGVPEYIYNGTTDLAGVSYNGVYKLVFFGFGAEAIMVGDPRWTDRHTVISRILNFFNYTWPAKLPETNNLAVSPGDPQFMTDHTPQADWTFYDEASMPQTAYRIQVSSTADFLIADLWDSGPIAGTETSVEYAGSLLADGQTYYIRVSTSNGILWSEWAVTAFRMNSVPTADGLSPSAGEEFNVNPPLLSHNTMTDAEGSTLTYAYQLFSDAGLTNLVEEATGLSPGSGDTTAWQMTTVLTDNETYYWRVRSTDDYEDGAWSPVESFLLVAAFVCGDASGDDQVNIGDAVFLITFIFKGGQAPDPLASGDTNGDGGTNIGDAVYLINFIFNGGADPVCE